MKDRTLDEAIVELTRAVKALKKLRDYRADARKRENAPQGVFKSGQECWELSDGTWLYYAEGREKAAAERAALDVRYILADLRQGR